MIHDETLKCAFDRNIDKNTPIALKRGKLCDACYNKIDKSLENYQILAIDQIFNRISYISRAKNPDKVYEEEMNIFVKKSQEIQLLTEGYVE